jgi:hypothetical protein
MPFTLSHAAAVWPFRRTRLEMSALLAGCFAPDFAYFMFIKPFGLFTHSLEGMFLIDLPVSLLALWLFHAFIKQPTAQLLPKAFRARLKPSKSDFSFWSPARLALIVISILIGTATHILWDSFTHPFYWPYRHWSFLGKMVQLPIEGNVRMFKVLQDGSTLFGLAVVAVWICIWYRKTEPVELPIREPYTRAQIRIIRMVVPSLALVGGIIKAHEDIRIRDFEYRPVLHFAVIGGIAATTFLGIGLLICGVFFRRRSGVEQQVRA